MKHLQAMACSKIFSGDLPEVSTYIIQNLRNDFNTLYSCALVNRFWCRLAIPLLWEDPFSIKYQENSSHFIDSLHSTNPSKPPKIFSFFTDDHRSTHTQILRVIVFLLLAAGFVAVVYYNIRKMATSDPVITTKVVENIYTPSIAFCSFSSDDYIEVKSAVYFYGQKNLTIFLNMIILHTNCLMKHGLSCRKDLLEGKGNMYFCLIAVQIL